MMTTTTKMMKGSPIPTLEARPRLQNLPLFLNLPRRPKLVNWVLIYNNQFCFCFNCPEILMFHSCAKLKWSALTWHANQVTVNRTISAIQWSINCQLLMTSHELSLIFLQITEGKNPWGYLLRILSSYLSALMWVKTSSLFLLSVNCHRITLFWFSFWCF